MTRTKLFILLVLLAAAFSTTSRVQAEEHAPYHLGSQDRVRVYVHEWPILTGEFTVGANGSLNLPFVGAVPAQGKDITQLALDIAQRLLEKARLDNPPETTVDIVTFRPFYILGSVERPGAYEYRPNMLVLNAVAIAGGLYRLGWNTERDAIAARGQVRIGASQLLALQAKEMRLKAELEGAETFDPKPQDSALAASGFLDQERTLFTARFEHFRHQYNAYGDTMALLDGEIASLEDQITASRKQEVSIKKELDDVRGLIARSLALPPRLLPIERALAQIEREQKEIATAIMRSRQQKNNTKMQREALKDERRSTALSELQTTEGQRKELEQQISTADDVLGSSSSLGSESVDGEPTYEIIRQQNGQAREVKAAETTPLEPGDILKVLRPQEIKIIQQNQEKKQTDNSPAATVKTR